MSEAFSGVARGTVVADLESGHGHAVARVLAARRVERTLVLDVVERIAQVPASIRRGCTILVNREQAGGGRDGAHQKAKYAIRGMSMVAEPAQEVKGDT
eukprot:2363505-Prymnesium_polylepis.2